MDPSGRPHRPPRSPHLPVRPLRRHSPGDRTALASQNHRWLVAYANSTDELSRRHWRDRLVEANLGLVHSVAARFSGVSQLPFSDLVQVGCQGLIRAVEAFDSRRARCLSTFAVPYVRGAIQHELRDREGWIRPPRRLWDLRQRAKGVRDQRRSLGLPPLDRDGLAAALSCSREELEEAEQLRQAATPLSLDALQGQGGGAEAGGTWLEQLADPRSLPQDALPRPDRDSLAQRTWLRRQLKALDPLQRDLLLGRVLLGCTWVELGQRLGLHPRMAERRCTAALQRLREAAQSWRDPDGSPPGPSRPVSWGKGA